MSERTGQARRLRFLHQRRRHFAPLHKGWAADFDSHLPLWTPLVEESQPSGLSSPYTHAPCWLKVYFSLKQRCCAPQLPPAFLSGQKMDLVLKKLNIKRKSFPNMSQNVPQKSSKNASKTLPKLSKNIPGFQKLSSFFSGGL